MQYPAFSGFPAFAFKIDFMRIIIPLLIGFMILGFSACSQGNPGGKAVIKTAGIQCDLCKNRVERYLSSEYGVSSVKVDIKKRTTTVTWIPNRTNLENIKTAIANLGFDADDVTAEPDAYNRLPLACRNHIQKPVSSDTTPKKAF